MSPTSTERPAQYRYTTSHEWARVENGNIIVIGVTDVFLRQVKNLVWLYFPELEEDLIKGRPYCEIEGMPEVVDAHAPVNGEVREINEALQNNIDLLMKDPFGEGWLVKLRVEDPGQIDDLLTLKAYEKLVGGGN